MELFLYPRKDHRLHFMAIKKVVVNIAIAAVIILRPIKKSIKSKSQLTTAGFIPFKY